MDAEEVIRELEKVANSQKAKDLSRFFKTGKGQYGEGDKFLGVVIPEIRKICLKFKDLTLSEIEKLVRNSWHEVRMCGLLLLIKQKNNTKVYLRNMKYINNWDLVDLSAPHVEIPKKTLYILAKSRNLWERRIAIINTFRFIRQNEFADTLKISEILLGDKQDLIHKAVGWLLREVGKRNKKVLEEFLEKHYERIPRTALRYAIEKFTLSERQAWLHK